MKFSIKDSSKLKELCHAREGDFVYIPDNKGKFDTKRQYVVLYEEDAFILNESSGLYSLQKAILKNNLYRGATIFLLNVVTGQIKKEVPSLSTKVILQRN